MPLIRIPDHNNAFHHRRYGLGFLFFQADVAIGEKQGHSYDKHRTGDDYDPDLVYPAAGYRDAETLDLPSGISERKLLTKIDLRVVPILSILYLL